MIPVLFKIGPLEVGSFGVMMALAFFACMYLLSRELQRHKLPKEWAADLTVWAAAAGIIGARGYFILEHFSEFLQDPAALIFSRGGLAWYGGFVLAALAIIWKINRYPASAVLLGDLIAPLLLLGYAIGRIGCFLAGDGDYGPPTDLPWGIAFPHGVVPTTVPVHPTPLYDFALSMIFFLLLWKWRKKNPVPGWMISGMFIFYGIERFITEFWRLTPKFWGWMTVPQAFSVLSILTGLVWGYYSWQRQKHLSATPVTENKRKSSGSKEGTNQT